MDLGSYSKIAVWGMGISGKAVSQYLKKKGICPIGIDREEGSFEDISIFSEKEKCLKDIQLIVKSPGITYEHPLAQKAKDLKIPIVGEIDLALSEIKKKKVIAITGSNGKTTTTLFTSHLLNKMGKTACPVGNVGVPVISQIENEAEFLVLELSSFQLEKIVPIAAFDRALILNITPNHLDRHAHFEEYRTAKLQIRTCLKNGGKFFVSKEIAQKLPFEAEIFDFYQEKVETIFSLGYRDGKNRFFPHDLQNFSAAYAAVQPTDEDFLSAIKTFQKPPHRIEFVREIDKVIFINDSKATSVDAVLKAVMAIKSPVVLLAGGVDKGGSFKDWLPVFKNKVSKVFTFGSAANRIFDELAKEIPTEKMGSMADAVNQAFKCAHPGDVVLLSPGCSSYDEFKDYQHRGEKFKEIVYAF